MTTPSFLTQRLQALLAGLALLLWHSHASAITIDPARPGLTQEQIEQFGKGIPADQYPRLLELLGREDESLAVRSLIKDQKPFPAAKLIEQLSSPKLAVRLGALDLLEEAAGETFGFDPWLEHAEDGSNTAALARWKACLEGGTAPNTGTPLVLDEEAFRTLAIEIMSGQRERAERAMARLDGAGLSALLPLESFLLSQPNLEAGARASLKMAEYRLILRQSAPGRAAALARDLALGTYEAQATAVTSVGQLGTGALPVIAEFLSSPDQLVRETAADAAFKAAGERACGLAIQRLNEEKAESVIHALIRGLGANGTSAESRKAILPFFDHPSENIVTGALEAVGRQGSPELTAAIERKLSDPRWRVRAAALEAASQHAELKPKIAEHLNDSDLFVRVAAVAAIGKLSGADIASTLLPVFEKQNELKPAILQAIFSLNDKAVPERVWAALDKAPPEIILQCLDTFEDRDDHEGKRAIYAARYADHPNRDVSAAALRILACHGIETGRLLNALVSNDEVKRDAVLDQLHLRPGALTADEKPSGASAPTARRANVPGYVVAGKTGTAQRSTALDSLYELFVGKSKAGGPGTRSSTEPQLADPAKMRTALERFFRDGSPRQRFCSALVLMQQGDAPAAKFLLESIESLSGLDRRVVAGTLGATPKWSTGPVADLATRLLRDPADDVREKAIEAWVEAKDIDRLAGLLSELVRPGSLLSPDDIYGWELDRLAQSPAAKSIIRGWAKKVLPDESARDSHKVLAIVLLTRSGQIADAGIECFRESKSPWLRRAAYRALRASITGEQLERLLKDEAAMVRVTVPFLAAPANAGWVHWFDDEHSAEDHEDFDENRYSGRSFGAWANPNKGDAKTKPALLAALETLTHDPSALVRFESQFALLQLGRPVDPGAFAGLIGEQPRDSSAATRLGNFLRNNYQRFGKGYAVLAQFVEDSGDSESHKRMMVHFGLNDSSTPVSVAEMAKGVHAVLRPSDLAVAPITTKDAVRLITSAFRVVFFHKPGCHDCERVREMLKARAREFPQMLVEEHDLNDAREALVNETLSARFHLKDVLHQVTPTVFTQAGAIVREQITSSRLGELLRTTTELAPNPAWNQVESHDVAQAKETITQRYETFSLGIVATAGLLDGVNPCAFATIIFLLSYLQVARRTPREILAVGGAFIFAVFLSYFVVGLGLAQILSRISGLRVAGAILNYVLAGFAFVVALMSFRDAQLAAKGNLGDMALQLPSGLKDRIRTVVRSGAKARQFVVAAFVVGVAISMLELACTGQVYLPTILYMLKSGSDSAVGHLLVYNIAFTIPLVIVFGLAWTGMRSDALIQFQRRNTALVKILTGVLFLALTAFLLFGSTLLPAISPSR